MGPLDDSTIPKKLAHQWQRQRQQGITTIIPKRGQHHDRDCDRDSPSSSLSTTNNNNSNNKFDGEKVITITMTGGCGCGAHQYRCRAVVPTTDVLPQHCYCRLCRQLSGSAFQSWIPIPHIDFEWTTATTTEEALLHRTTDFGQRHICRTCGSVMTILYDDNEDRLIWPAMGSLHSQSLHEFVEKTNHQGVHICCAWKQSWYQLPIDGMPRIEYAS